MNELMTQARNKVQKKTKNKKGFTLVELLIVIAIIAIMVAIAIPVYSAQLDSARTQVDAANLRTAESLAMADFMLNRSATATGDTTYYFNTGANNQIQIAYGTGSTLASTGSFRGSKETAKTPCVVITMAGVVSSCSWTTP